VYAMAWRRIIGIVMPSNAMFGRVSFCADPAGHDCRAPNPAAKCSCDGQQERVGVKEASMEVDQECFWRPAPNQRSTRPRLRMLNLPSGEPGIADHIFSILRTNRTWSCSLKTAMAAASACSRPSEASGASACGCPTRG